ncbi:MAG TPA: GFA family protein [Myxococcales bacterium]|nr:GFA family protein [Myxococcales bacterium]
MPDANPTGACCCGGVKFRLLASPMFVHCCHCTDCQRHTGSAFVINAIIETDRIEILSGAPEPVSMPTESGRPHDIYRCPTCKVAVWSDYGRRPKVRFVRVGTLFRPHSIQPDVHIYTRSKVPWLRLPEGARAFEVYYDVPKEWPAESLARRQAAIG